MHVHFNQGVIRGYEDDKNFANRDPFIYSMNFMLLNPETAFISSLIAKQKISAISGIKCYFIEIGVKQVIADLPTKFMPKGFKPLADTGLYILKLDGQ